MRFIFVIIVFSLVVGCSQQQESQQTVVDCSEITIPSDREVNTNLDKDNNLLSASWLDNTGENITVTIKYTDKNCSESVNMLISHVVN